MDDWSDEERRSIEANVSIREAVRTYETKSEDIEYVEILCEIDE